MKKVLAVATILSTVSAFAAWDKFPVIDYGKGEVKLGIEQSRQSSVAEDPSTSFKVRYSPLANLELTSEVAADVFGNYVLGARYQIIPVLSAGVDFGFPLSLGANWSFKPSVQFSMPLGPLTLGSNFDLTIYTGTAKYSQMSKELGSKFNGCQQQPCPDNYVTLSRGLDFTGGIELDFAIGKSTIYASFDATTGVTRSKLVDSDIQGFKDGYKKKFPDDVPLKDDERLLTLIPTLGYIASLGNLELGTYVSFIIGSDKVEVNGKEETEPFATAVGVEASVKF